MLPDGWFGGRHRDGFPHSPAGSFYVDVARLLDFLLGIRTIFDALACHGDEPALGGQLSTQGCDQQPLTVHG